MKSRKLVVIFENTPTNIFFSITYYSLSDKRLHKGQRVLYQLVCYEEGSFVQCEALMAGLWNFLGKDSIRLCLTKTNSIMGIR